jgi:hypothetical protein
MTAAPQSSWVMTQMRSSHPTLWPFNRLFGVLPETTSQCAFPLPHSSCFINGRHAAHRNPQKANTQKLQTCLTANRCRTDLWEQKAQHTKQKEQMKCKHSNRKQKAGLRFEVRKKKN